jgi:hypothetical protein
MLNILAVIGLAILFSLNLSGASPTFQSNSTRALFERELSKVSKRSVTGPAIKTNFPDPSIIFVPGDGLWHAFATNGNGKQVQTATSPDFVTWTVSVLLNLNSSLTKLCS